MSGLKHPAVSTSRFATRRSTRTNVGLARLDAVRIGLAPAEAGAMNTTDTLDRAPAPTSPTTEQSAARGDGDAKPLAPIRFIRIQTKTSPRVLARTKGSA